jgi:hypothetical protein
MMVLEFDGRGSGREEWKQLAGVELLGTVHLCHGF